MTASTVPPLSVWPWAAHKIQTAIDAKYNSMKKEIQINVVKELSELSAHLPLCGTTSQTVTGDEEDAADILLSHNIPFPAFTSA